MQVFGQNDSIRERQKLITEIYEAAAKKDIRQHPVGNVAAPMLTIQASKLLPPEYQKQILLQQPVKRDAGVYHNSGNRTTTNCQDTSYGHLLGVYNGWMYLQSITQTMDGGILVSALLYDSTRLPSPFSKSYGLLIKLDGNGQVSWLKQFEDLTSDLYSETFMDNAFELQNHDIICAGFLNNTSNSSVYKSLVYRLTPDGNVIWKNCLKNTIGIFGSPSGTFTYRIESAVEGLYGDIILCGTSASGLTSGSIETVVRLDTRGQLVWDVNYGNHGVDGSYLFGAEGKTAFMQNGQIMLVGMSHGSSYPSTPPAINFLTLDYKNGSLLSKRFFRPSYTDPSEEFKKTFTWGWNKVVRLTNGHMLIYGKLLSELLVTTGARDYFGVTEFDASFNLVNAYTIGADLQTNYESNGLYFDESGRGLISVLHGLGSYDAYLYFGAFSNHQFTKQRKAHYLDVGLPGNSGFAFLKNNAYAYMQSYFQSQPVTKSYFEFRKMHDSDTSSQCLGQDTMLFNFSPLHIIEDPGYYYLDANEPGKIIALIENIRQTDTTSTSKVNSCKQINYCDTVKIHGDSSICGSASSMVFTAFKNKECGAIVQWTIDNNAIDSLHNITDSSVRIWFKNINWHGKIYASMAPLACNTVASDSITMSIVRVQSNINLGADTLLCSFDNKFLHAGNGFNVYLWQDGSSDSLLKVNKPGLYWVQASDLCGNTFTDSIQIGRFNAVINIGSDRTKCNNDTLHLSAPPGFLNYTWSNNYNISSTSSQTIIANPLIDTAYFIKAEQRPGCFAYDTVRVHVNTSPPINLGPDKRFCKGDSVVLNTGSGFREYLWSNNSTSNLIVIRDTGTYSFIGTTAQGCKSYDTVKVLTIFSNPVLNLDHDKSICAGSTRVLDAGDYSTYLWSNGSKSRYLSVTGIGLYVVEVTDVNGCRAKDTTVINTLLPLPNGFLPADTSLCSYGTILLQATASYTSYLWSTGASSSAINIAQPGSYWLQVKDMNNCRGRDTVNVALKDCLKGVYVPSAFTPNTDGKNDLFRPLLFGTVRKYQFTVYNRWGQVVFQTLDIAKGWDGTYNGRAQDSNIFVWNCSYQFEGDEAKSQKGTVMLIR